MFRGNLQRTGYYPAEDKGFRGEIAWKHIVVGGAFRAPAMVHAGRVFCGSTSSNVRKNKFWALDVQTGEPEWSQLLENEMRLTPCVGDDRVIIADGDVLQVRDIENGVEQWTARMKRFVDSVTIYGKMVIVGERGTGSHENFLSAFHLDTGKKLWSRKFKNILPCYPTIADGTLFLVTQSRQFGEMLLAAFSSPRVKRGVLAAIDCETGDLKWPEAETPGPIVGTPIWHDDILYVPYHEGVSMHDAESGEWLWQCTFSNDRISAPAAIKKDLLLCTLGEGVIAKNIRTGKKAWEFRVPVDAEADRNEMAYLNTTSAVSIMGNTAVVGINDGYMYGIDVRTGKSIWKCELDELEEEDIDSLHIYPKWVPVCGENMIFIAAGNTLYALQ